LTPEPLNPDIVESDQDELIKNHIKTQELTLFEKIFTSQAGFVTLLWAPSPKRDAATGGQLESLQ